MCTVCGSSDPGLNSSWLANYSLCGPCSSLRSCPVCSQSYTESDLIVQCGHCVRWLHGRCDRMNTEAEAELCFSAADEPDGTCGYNCPLCRTPSDPLPAHLQPGNAKALIAMNQAFAAAAALANGSTIPSKDGRNSSNSNSSSPTPPTTATVGSVTSPTAAAAAAAAAAVAVAAALTTDRPKSSASTSSPSVLALSNLPTTSTTPTSSQLFVVDGVSLSEGGMNHLRSLQLLDQPRRRCRGKNKAQQEQADADGLLGAGDVAGLDELLIGSDGQPPLLTMTTLKDGTVAMVARRREDGRPPDLPEGYTLVPGENGQLIVRKKRQRNLQKLGIGGFQVRRPWARVRDKEDDINNQQAEGGDPSITAMATSEKRKPQQRRNNKAKGSKLVETYPSYLQEAFFGRELLTTPTPVPSKSDSLPGLSSDVKGACGSDSDDNGDVLFADDVPIHHRAAKDPSVVIQLSKEEVAELMERSSQRSSSSLATSVNIKNEPLIQQQRPCSSASSTTRPKSSASVTSSVMMKQQPQHQSVGSRIDLDLDEMDDDDDVEEDEASVLKDMFPLAGCDLLDSADDLVDSIMKEGDAGQADDDDDVIDDSDLMDDNSSNPLPDGPKGSVGGKAMIRMGKADHDNDDDDDLMTTDDMLMTMRMSGMSEQTMANLDTMVATAARADSGLEDALTAAGLPNMDCNDVDDIFKGVLDTAVVSAVDSFIGPSVPSNIAMPSPQQQQMRMGVQPQHHQMGQMGGLQAGQQTQTFMQQQQGQVPPPPPPPAIPHRALSSLSGSISQGTTSPSQNNSVMPQQQQLQQLQQQQQQPPPPPCSPYFSEYSSSPGFSPAFSEPPASPWPTSSSSNPGGGAGASTSSSADLMAGVMDSGGSSAAATANQRNALKWEADEALGLSATISAVLYANTNHPELKRDFPAWTERWKQIAKIWRSLAAERKAPFLQKARENRAAVRLHKSQQQQPTTPGGGGLLHQQPQQVIFFFSRDFRTHILL